MGWPFAELSRPLPPREALPPVDWRKLRRLAKRKLPRFLFDYIEGGALDEHCLERNVRELRALRLVGHPLDAPGLPDLRTRFFDTEAAMPLAIAPTGLNDLIRPGADLAIARAAASCGIPFIRSAASLTAVNDIARVSGHSPWYQLYFYGMHAAEQLAEGLAQTGCGHLVVTVDLPVGGVRRRDDSNRLGVRVSPPMVLQALCRPGWLLRMLANRAMPVAPRVTLDPQIAARRFAAGLGWKELRRLRDCWPGRLWVKGVLNPNDAAAALDCGADGLIVSNHGGRQLDASPTAWSVLPAIRSVSGNAPLLADGGVRTGEDIALAMALGASGVLVGRPVLWALAAGGGRLVAALLAQLERELTVTLQLLGCAAPAAITPANVIRPDQTAAGPPAPQAE